MTRFVPVYVSDVVGQRVLSAGGLPRLTFEAAIHRCLDEADRKAKHAAEMRLIRYGRIFGWRW